MFTMLLLACGSPDPQVDPFEGPDGVTDVVTDQEEVLVAMTHLQVRNLPGPGKRFGNHASAVGEYLYEEKPAGWLGASFRNVGKLDWWTMTVWESEEAMLDFVISEPHLSAMAALEDVAVAAESRAEWMAVEDAPPEWTLVVEALEDDAEFEYLR